MTDVKEPNENAETAEMRSEEADLVLNMCLFSENQ